MKIDILTLFPEMFDSLNASILGRAQDKKLITINMVNIRDFSKDKHKKCDDYPFGGGAGMVMTPQPLYDSVKSVKKRGSHIIYMSPKGKTLNQQKVEELSKLKHIIIICGHYEGIDERIIEIFKPEQISIGDYVLTGGELPAQVLIDSVSRYVDGVLGSEESNKDESFACGLLEYPHYTRPADFMGLKVPQVLVGGNHAEINKWRKQQSLEITKKNRPDMAD